LAARFAIEPVRGIDAPSRWNRKRLIRVFISMAEDGAVPPDHM
jgi:hypothetical protein